MFVDSRVGSKMLAPKLRQAGLPVTVTRLEYGDVAFQGQPTRGTVPDIGIEFKTLGDLVSSLRTNRLAGHQLVGLRQAYDVAYLVVEGVLAVDTRGHLFSQSGRQSFRSLHMSASELLKRVLTLHHNGGLIPWFTTRRRETILVLEALYRFWTDKSLDEHTSHIAIHEPPTLVTISEFRQAVCKWPGVGLEWSRAVEQTFGGSIRRAVVAPERDWSEMCIQKADKRRRFGHTAAKRVREFFK